jgi:hypothetical protein
MGTGYSFAADVGQISSCSSLRIIFDTASCLPLPAWIEATCQTHHQEFEAHTRPIKAEPPSENPPTA